MKITSQSQNTQAGPLSGIQVLDLSSVVLGPMATQVLADLGADVVKIEAPTGDIMRANGVSKHKEISSIFLSLNRNKRSAVLDLKSENGAKALKALILRSDVLIHNMRISAIKRLGFSYEEVKKINKKIIYCAATGFGQDGPYHARPAFDDIIQAACGLVGLSSVSSEEPQYMPSLVADKITGLVAASGIMAALIHREKTGQGQYLEVPMLETMTSFVLAEHMGGMAFPGSNAPAGYKRLMEGGRRPVKTADGWMGLLPYTAEHWKAFFSEAGRDELLTQYDLESRQYRNAHIAELYSHVRDIALQRTTAEWMAICQRLDIPATPIYSLSDLPQHPHLEAVKLFEERVHPTIGPIREIRPSTRFSETPTSIRIPAPMLGQHTEEILKAAGLEDSEIEKVLAENSIK